MTRFGEIGRVGKPSFLWKFWYLLVSIAVVLTATNLYSLSWVIFQDIYTTPHPCSWSTPSHNHLTNIYTMSIILTSHTLVHMVNYITHSSNRLQKEDGYFPSHIDGLQQWLQWPFCAISSCLQWCFHKQNGTWEFSGLWAPWKMFPDGCKLLPKISWILKSVHL